MEQSESEEFVVHYVNVKVGEHSCHMLQQSCSVTFINVKSVMRGIRSDLLTLVFL